jgi:hypothetical protein
VNRLFEVGILAIRLRIAGVVVALTHRTAAVVLGVKGAKTPVPSCRSSVVLMHEATESIPSPNRRANDRGAAGGGRSWWTSTECSVRALTVVMLDEDTQEPVEVARSEDQ